MTRTRLASLGAMLATVSLLVVWASPAEARWKVHNANDVTQMTAPSGGTENQTCTDSLVGETGWSTFVSPEEPAPDPIPSSAFTGVNYELWKPPPGFASMNEGVEQVDANGNTTGYLFFDLNGNESAATLVKAFTTANRTLLPAPEPINGGPPTGDVYVFTTAPFNEAISGVGAGDTLGLKPTGGATFIDLGGNRLFDAVRLHLQRLLRTGRQPANRERGQAESHLPGEVLTHRRQRCLCQ